MHHLACHSVNFIFVFFVLLSTHADRQGVDISAAVVCLSCSFVFFLCLYTVTDFSGEDKAGVKFCTVVRRRPGQGISHFGELCSPRSPKSDESVT